ncbi:hypothetical protein C8Q77DRAFT_1217593 [Trametes polyzona]|nr:hypothetical protein C8Q77DRAFT_1217593 [Trametes polyzona]
MPLVDAHDRVFMVLVGSPADEKGWSQVNMDVQAAFEEAREQYQFTAKQVDHRRGAFPAFAAGISYGGGQKHPQNLVHTARNMAVIKCLLDNQALRRVAGFGDASMKLFAPRLHTYYQETMSSLTARDPTLKPNFSNGAFASATFNLGPQVSTYPHVDHLNLPTGWCAITAFGDFNPQDGGHLILWELGIMIEFPPGALILLPSAMLCHSNTTVAPGEHRYSFTQYSAGGLFRWAAFLAKGGRLAVDGRGRWSKGIEMFSKWGELCLM